MEYDRNPHQNLRPSKIAVSHRGQLRQAALRCWVGKIRLIYSKSEFTWKLSCSILPC